MEKLTPFIHPNVKRFLADENQLFDLIDAHGSPLNIVFPEQVKENIDEFTALLQHQSFRSQLYYAHKPNKSTDLLQAVKEAGQGVDVASYGELMHAIEVGFSADKIEATGPKNDRFIKAGVKYGITFNVDSLIEICRIAHFVKELGVGPINIFVRLNGFSSDHTMINQLESRFGILVSDIDTAFNQLNQEKEWIALKGFSFHVNTGGKQEKIIAIENTLSVLLKAHHKGFHQATTINIGGGFHINYLEQKEEWEQYISALKNSVLHNGERLSWNDSGLGLKNTNGVLTGSENFGQFYREMVKACELKSLLEAPLKGFDNQTFGEVLSDLLLTLVIEPGRALLDQAGITITSVLDVKKTTLNDYAVIVDMNRSNINSIDLEMMVDPLLMSNEKKEEPFGAFIAGNLCLNSDIIYRHKTFFPQKPKRGDLLVFINTAPYNMDFAESQTLQQPIAQKITV